MNDAQQPPTPDACVQLREEPHDREPEHPATEPDRIPTKTRRLRGGQRLAAGVLLLLCAALGIGFWQHYRLHAQVIETAEQRRNFIPNVRTAPVRASDSTMAVTWPGTTEAFDAADIYAHVSGYITERAVDIGDHVKKGQELAQIDPRPYQAALDRAHGQLAHDQGVLAQAQMDLKRYQTLEAQQSIAAQTEQDQVYVVQQDQGTVELDQANVETAQLNLQYTHIIAPFDGVVTQRNVDIGSLVQADATTGTFLFTLMHSDVIRIQLYVPQNEAFGLGPGVDAVVRVPEMPGRDFPGTVTRIADALQPGTRTLLTEIDVPNPDHALSPGTYCTVELKIPRKTPSLIVPSEAIIFNRDGLSVAVVEDGIARIHAVTVVRDFGTTVEVSAGVKDGDQVILNPPVDLADGHKVKVRPGPHAQLS
jgi:RND family efflux transporter MFP subunit